MLRRKERHLEAERVLGEVVEGREKLLGINHHDTLTSKCEYGINFYRLEKYSKS